MGKQLIDYVIESGDERNMINFFKFNSADNYNKQSLLVLINEQLKHKTSQTLFQTMYEIMSNNVNLKTDCILVLERLLFEMVEIEDIEYQCDIATVLAMKQMTHRDEILRLLIVYSKIEPTNYVENRTHPYLKHEIYDLIIMLKKENDVSFKETFSLYLIKMMHQHNENYQTHVQKDANILLTLALRHGQKHAMETIITCQTIEINKIQITTDKSVSTYEHINYLMKLMLRHGYNVHELNHSWVNVEVFEDSLDARIIEEDKNNILIDYKSYNYNNGLIINQDDNKSLFSFYNILNNRCMKNNITHPVLSTIINLKAIKYQRFYAFNFWMFIVIYMLPFYILLSHQNQMNSLWIWCIYVLCMIGTGFLIIREFVQFRINESGSYFRKISNYIEVVLIVVSMIVLIIIPVLKRDDSDWMKYLSALLIILATVEVLTFLPFNSMAIYMFMFKNVAMTITKFLLIFLLIIFAFAFSFSMVMKPAVEINEHTSSNKTIDINKFEFETIVEKSLKKKDDEENIMNNFGDIFTSIMKTLQMLSGEFTIEPFSLDFCQKMLVFCFVITSIILYNLIIGLAISDIQDVKEQADFLFLQNQVEKTLQTSKVISKFKNCAER